MILWVVLSEWDLAAAKPPDTQPALSQGVRLFILQDFIEKLPMQVQ